MAGSSTTTITFRALAPTLALALSACVGDQISATGPLAESDASIASDGALSPDAAAVLPTGIVFRSQVTPITRVADALPGVFIPPFDSCRDPKSGEAPGKSANGQVCTHTMISGCTEPGRYFPDYADCDVVRRQRPYWPRPPTKTAAADDPRLADAAYLADMQWVGEQIAASGCTCCHDQRVTPMGASQWDISLGPLWIDSLSDSGLGLFTGLANSDVLGAYPAADNYGFDRDQVGIPSTDPTRMQAIMLRELARRGLSEDYARGLTPFGGPIYENSVRAPVACAAGQGVTSAGDVLWIGGNARYVYVLEESGKNPGVPPNFDLPAETLWRLDVLASQPSLPSGLRFGTTPPGSFQTFPEATAAAALTPGKRYRLFVQADMAVPVTNCIFTFGEVVPAPVVDAGTPDAGSPSDSGTPAGDASTCASPGPDGEPRGVGTACTVSGSAPDQCKCAASYCSKSPFEASGYCTVTGCDTNPSVCPSGWQCFNVGTFSPGEPWICMKP